MSEQKWKPGQLQAIEWRGGELIVSASAGTGKTSVIIERAWQIVLTGRAHVDELLIATFTEDAAEQLKTRLRSRLDQEMSQETHDEVRARLREQLHRLDRAQVSTIHALCLRIVRENYYRLGIASDISILAPEQAVLIKHQVLDRLFEDCYADKTDLGQRFRDLVVRYGGRSFDQSLSDMILSIHNFLGSLADPQAWIDQVRKQAATYRSDDFKITSLKSWDILKQNWLNVLAGAKTLLQKARQKIINQGSAKLQSYVDDLVNIVERREKLLSQNHYEKLGTEIAESLPRSPQVRKDSPEIEWWPPVKEQIDSAKDMLKSVGEDLTLALAPEQVAYLKNHAVFLDTIMDLVESFSAKLLETKESEGHLEFDDLQRLALDLLGQPEVVENYRNQFKFVLVDEYQDINELQDTILRRLGRSDPQFPDRIGNLFTVGDVKQSIYRFRLAEPEIFQKLYQLAAPGTDSGLARIDLPDNFRSRRQVLDAVNSVFTPILRGGELELHYDKGSQLVCGANFPEAVHDVSTELHILERKITNGDDDAAEESEFAEMEANSREAFLAARRIKELIDSKFLVTENNQSRPVEPEDVVILLRSMRNIVGTYITMLRRVGLNAYCEQVEAFLEYPEIADIVALLKIINNPFQDIPLATVLRSPLVGASLSELVQIRQSDPKYLYDGLLKYIQDNPDAKKFVDFIRQFHNWRQTAGCCCVAELVQQIYLDTAYPDYVRATMPGQFGAENLDQFLQLSWQFSSDTRCDLPYFLEYLDLVAERSSSLSGVRSGVGKGVRIMTVHASKGLEYPVVVLGNVGRKVNLQDLRSDMLIDRNLLIGLREVDPASLAKEETLPFLALAKSVRNKSTAEELRLLYVAMTRAKEKLILVGSDKLPILAKNLRQIVPGENLSPSQVASWQTPLGWIAISLVSSNIQADSLINALESVEQTKIDAGPLKITVYPSDAQTQWSLQTESWSKVAPDVAEKLLAIVQGKNIAAGSDASSLAGTILNQIAWEYPHKDLIVMPTSVSVTQLIEPKEKSQGKTNWTRACRINADRQNILMGLESSHAIQKGHAWHRFLQYLDLNQPIDSQSLQKQLLNMLENKSITSVHARLIDLSHVERFFKTAPGKIMLEYRDSLYRELPFTYSLPAKQFPQGARPGESDEPVLIQGIIDCLVPTPKGIVIIDYKTNNIESAQVDAMVEHYRIQLNLYAQAIGEILRQPIHSAWLYFTNPHAAVQVL